MAESREVYSVELDVSDFVRKAEVIEKKLAEIEQARKEGRDTSELEQTLAKELDGLGKLVDKDDEASHATKELLSQKEKLGAVVRSLGGQFSGMIGDLGGVVELLISGSKAAMMFAGALAGITALTALVGKLKQEWQEVVDKQREAIEAWRQMRQAALEPQQQMADTLARFGALTAETERAAVTLAGRIVKSTGVEPQAAIAVAPLALLAGVGTEDAALAAQLVAVGESIDTPEALKRALSRLKAQPQRLEALQRQLAALPETATGKTRIRWAKDHLRPVMPTTEELAYEAARARGIIPTDMSFAEFKERADKVRALHEALEYAQREEAFIIPRSVLGPAAPGFAQPADYQYARRLFEELRGSELLPLLENAGRPASAPQAPITVNVGTVYLRPDTQMRPRAPEWYPGASGPTGPLHKEPILP